MLEQVFQYLSSSPVKWDWNLCLTAVSEISLNFCKAKVSQHWETAAERVRLNKQDLSQDCYHIQTMCYTKSLSPQPGNSLGFQLRSFYSQCHRNHGYNIVLNGHSTKCHCNAIGSAQNGTAEAVIFEVISSDTRGRFSIHRALLRARILKDICTFKGLPLDDSFRGRRVM